MELQSSACCCVLCCLHGTVFKLFPDICISPWLAFSWQMPILFALLLWRRLLGRSLVGWCPFCTVMCRKNGSCPWKWRLSFLLRYYSLGLSLHMEVLGCRFWSISMILVVSRFYFQAIIPNGSPLVTYWMFPQASLDFYFLTWVSGNLSCTI